MRSDIRSGYTLHLLDQNILVKSLLQYSDESRCYSMMTEYNKFQM